MTPALISWRIISTNLIIFRDVAEHVGIQCIRFFCLFRITVHQMFLSFSDYSASKFSKRSISTYLPSLKDLSPLSEYSVFSVFCGLQCTRCVFPFRITVHASSLSDPFPLICLLWQLLVPCRNTVYFSVFCGLQCTRCFFPFRITVHASSLSDPFPLICLLCLLLGTKKERHKVSIQRPFV
jgi:hypothetical protein